MNFINKLFFIVSLILLITILFITSVYFPLEENSTTQKIVNIPFGTNAKEIVNVLGNNEIIRKNNYTFRILIKLMKLEGQLKYGEYNLSPSMNMFQILDKLIKGEVIVYKITIPEGYTCKQIAELLEKKEIAEKEKFIELIIKDKEKSEEIGFSLDQIIILASIIEKEAKFNDEKNRVSSVFHNRLKTGMKLQSCATIQYILGTPKEKLDENDLKIESPYNTYLYKGLPPGPICNPGLDSIMAALEPAEEDYLYFVLGENGRHVFSKTYEEHLKNKK